MKYIVVLPFLLFCLTITAQKMGDTKITITLNDSNDVYRRVKIALVDLDFIVKDDYRIDTITTYPREFSSIPGQCRLTAIIKGNIVIMTGIYGLKRVDDWGYYKAPKEYQNIIYYRASKGWQLLEGVSEKIGGRMTFGK